MQKQITLGSIFGEFGDSYLLRNNVMGQEKGLVHLLSSCRTGALGSHYEKCDSCDYIGKSYNSCRNRHCPACQGKDKQEWTEKRMAELLPTGYFHLVFTIPHELNALCLANKKAMYGLLFKAASGTVLELAKDTKHLGADTGLLTVLHSWGQNLMDHPHLHCIMPAGGLSFDRRHWVHTKRRGKFFVHAKVLSRKFRGKFLDLLKIAYENGELQFKGKLCSLGGKKAFAAFTDVLYKKEWVVNIQAPLGKPHKVLEYLSRYVFRIAISDRRILKIKDDKVLFSWKDNRTGHFRKMELGIDEFIRRFLLHVLPKGFFKVRYYGIFSNRHRKENIETAKRLLDEEALEAKEEALEDGNQVWEKHDAVWDGIMMRIQHYQKPNCPVCKKGRLRFAGIVREDLMEPG